MPVRLICVLLIGDDFFQFREQLGSDHRSKDRVRYNEENESKYHEPIDTVVVVDETEVGL